MPTTKEELDREYAKIMDERRMMREEEILRKRSEEAKNLPT